MAFLYGHQWTPSVPLVRVLAAFGFFNTILLAPGWLHAAAGTVKRQVRWEAVNLIALGVAFGLELSGEQTGAIMAVVTAALGFVTRAKVTPAPKRHDVNARV